MKNNDSNKSRKTLQDKTRNRPWLDPEHEKHNRFCLFDSSGHLLRRRERRLRRWFVVQRDGHINTLSGLIPLIPMKICGSTHPGICSRYVLQSICLCSARPVQVSCLFSSPNVPSLRTRQRRSDGVRGATPQTAGREYFNLSVCVAVMKLMDDTPAIANSNTHGNSRTHRDPDRSNPHSKTLQSLPFSSSSGGISVIIWT